MPDDVGYGQGSQADLSADAQPGNRDSKSENHDSVDKQNVTAAKSDDVDLMVALGIPKEIRAQLSPTVGEEPKLGDPEIDKVSGKPVEGDKAERPGESDEQDPEDAADTAATTPKPEEKKPDKVQRRIDKLTKEKADAKAENERLIKMLETALGQKPGSSAQAAEEPEVPAESHLAYVKDEKQLNQEISKATALIKWCNANSKGVEDKDGKFIEPEQISEWKGEAELVMLSAPNRRDEIRTYNGEKQHFDTLARQAWPELFDKDTKEYQLGQAILREFPAVKYSPRAMYAVGLTIEGMKQVQARAEKANGNGKPGSPIPVTAKERKDIDPRVFGPRVPVAPHTPEPPSREGRTLSQKKLSDAMTNLVKDSDGSAQSLAAVLAAEEEMVGKR